MATINVGINVGTQGMQAANAQAATLAANLQAAAAAATKVGTATRAAQQGVANSNASRAPASSFSSGVGNPPGNSGSGLSRGIAGQTGAEGRDFAKQAQGLGGLVHVYATFAANLFAVSAAFTALSKAADTTNLVKGLDQLGAASGKNLGSVSKRIVELTDGAVSLREAMVATAQASSAGISTKNIERLASVAKNTSQALGIGMPDALSRLSRGIAKIEPELLDELGIMVKVDKASQDYARSLGKTSSQLTDFEKRQGFANAVLAEAEEKFGAIKMDSNPYSKLSAALANLAQNGLEKVNNLLTPLIGFMASSPTALTVAIAGFGAMLLKQAVPAIGMFRENSRRMEQEAHARVQRQVKEQQAAALQSDDIINKKARHEFETSASTAAKIAELQAARFNKSDNMLGPDLRATLRKSAFDVTPEETAALHKRQEVLSASEDAAQKAQGDKLKTHLAKQEALRQESFNRGFDAQEKSIERDDKWYTHQSLKARELANLKLAEAKRGVLAGVSDTTAILGPLAALRQLKEEVPKLDMTPIGKGFMYVRGAASIAAGAVSTFLGALGGLLGVIGIIGAAVGILASVLSKNADEMGAFNGALTGLKDAGDGATRTMDLLSKQKPLKQMSISSISAVAAAFLGLTDSISSVTDSTQKALEKLNSSRFDKFTNWVAKLWGGDIASKAAEGISSSLVKSIGMLDEGDIKKAYTDSLKNILDVGDLGTDTITKALEKISKLDPSVLTSKLKELYQAQVTASTAFNNSSSDLNTYKSSFDNVTKASQDFLTSMNNNDPLFKYGASLLSLSDAFSKLSSSPEDAKVAIIDLLGDTKKLGQFSESTQKQLLGMKDSFLANTAAAKANANALKAAEAEVDSLNTAEVKAYRASMSIQEILDKPNGDKAKAAIKAMDAEYNLHDIKLTISKANINYDAVVKQATELVTLGMQESFMKGADLIDKALSMAGARAAIEISKAAGVGLTGSRATTQELDLVKQEVGLRMQEIKLRQEEIASQAKLINTIQLSDAKKALAEDKALNGGKNSVNLTQAENILLGIQKALDKGSAGIKEAYNKGRAKTLPDTATTEQKDQQREAQGVAQGVAGLYTQTSSLDAAKIAEQSKVTTAEIAAQSKYYSDIGTKVTRIYKTFIDTNTAEAERLNIIDNILGGTDLEITKQKIKAQNLAEFGKQESDNFQITTKINTALALSKNPLVPGKVQAAQAQEAAYLATVLAAQKRTQSEKNIITALSNQQTVLKGSLDILNKSYDVRVSELNLLSTIANAQQSILDAQLTARIALGNLDESDKVALTYANDVKKSQLATQTALNLKLEEANKLQSIRAEERKAFPVDTPQKELDTFDKETARQQGIQSNAIVGILIEGEARKKVLDITKESNTFLAKQTDSMKEMVSVTESLSTIFGELGMNIGKAGEALLKMAHDDEKYNKERISLNEKLAEAMSVGDTEEEAKATAKLNTLDKKFAKDKLSNIASVAGAHKKLFAEHTVAYKVLGAVEKAAHTYKLAMQFKEMATDALAFAKKIFFVEAEVPAVAGATAAKTGIELAGQAATMPAKIAGTYASFMSMLGPFGPPAAALAIAEFIGSAFGGGGGGSISPGPSQEEMRAVQGTGQAYNSAGTLVDTGKGVFGDPTAVNKGIKESLDLLAATAKPELAYTSKMVMLLANIDNSLSGAANSLTASGFKIDPASYASLGRTKESGGINNISTPALLVATGMVGTVVAKVLGKVFGNIGGSASSYFEVTGGGFEVPLQKLTDAVDNFTSKGYVVANKIASDGGIEAIRNPDEYGGRGTEVNAEFNASIGRALKEASTTAKEIAIAFGASSQEVDATLSNFVVNMGDIDLFGAKTLEEKSEIINAKIGGVIDDILEQTLPTALREFRKGGETLLTTASRVSSGIEEANFYLNQLGVTSVKYTEVLRTLGDVSSEIVRQSIVLKEGTNGVAELINAFSGTAEEISSFYTELSSLRNIFEDTGVSTNILTSKFLNLGGGLGKISGEVSDYYKNFYSEAERNLDSAKAVSAKLGKVGLTYSPEEIVSMTKAQFRGIVEGLGTVTPESEAAYIALMGVSEAINEISSSAKNSNADQIQLLKLQGKEVEALRLTRLNELDGLVGTARLIRTQIHDQEDLNKTKSLELGLATALGMTTEVLNYTRQKELDTLSLMDRAIKQATYAIEDFNKTRDLEVALLTAQGDILAAVTHAREKELKGLSESNKLIQQRIYLLQDEATTIAAAKAVESARVTVANAYAGFVNAAKTSGETLVSAEENITRGYLAAKDKADKALIASNDVVLGEADRVSKAGIETGKKLKDFAKNIRKFIDEITYGSIDTNHQLVYLQRVFDDTLAKARTGNEDALNTLTDSASKLLEKGKDTSVTFLDFARLTGRTAADLTSVADALDAKADPLLVSILGLTDEQIAANDAAKDYAKRSLEAQTALNDANKELADWTKAVKESTASTEEILIDYAKDWRKANTEDIKARSELLEATKIIGATNSKVPTALDGLRDAMTAMGTAIQSLATNLGAFTGAVLSAVQSQQLSAADAVTKLAAVGTNLAKDSISTVATATDNTTVYASSTGKALAIDNKDGKDYTVYGTTIKATGQEIRDWIAKQTNPIDIYNGAVSQGISSQMLADIASFPVSEIRDWVSANNLPAFAFGGDHSGGIRLVGENGPEIESTGPSRIFNASQTRGMLQQDNSELIAEIRLLRSEVKELKEINKASSDSEKTTAKQLTRWDTDGMPPIRT